MNPQQSNPNAAKPAAPASPPSPPAKRTMVKSPAVDWPIKGVTLRAPLVIGAMQCRSLQMNQDNVVEILADYESQLVWVHRDMGHEEAWGSTPFSNVISTDYGKRTKGGAA